MTRAALVLAAVVALGGCRLERAAPSEAPGHATPDDAISPPDGAGARANAARVGPGAAGVAEPGLVERLQRAPSGLIIPVPGIASVDLVDTFNAARSEGRRHDAIDILAPRGTPVVAASAGTVARLFESERGGLTVYVVAGAPDGAGRYWVHYYAHLDAYAPGLADGQRVRAWQMLGTVGDTGNAAPGNTHLHFAIWTVADPAQFWDGPALNPYPLLGGR